MSEKYRNRQQSATKRKTSTTSKQFHQEYGVYTNNPISVVDNKDGSYVSVADFFNQSKDS